MTTTPTRPLVFTYDMRRKFEEQEAERRRLATIFDPDHAADDGLNVEAIRILISWAEQDVNLLQKYRSLGNQTWDQGTWGTLHVPEAAIPQGSIETDEDDDEMVRDEDRVDVVDRAMLNGACQTAFCMAGQTVVQAGHRMIYDDLSYNGGGYFSSTAENCVRREWTGQYDERGWPIFEDIGEVGYISNKAGQILGLDDQRQDEFFNGSNTVGNLKWYANRFCDEDGLEPMYPEEEVTPRRRDDY